jgi:phosphate transport system protein
MPEDIRHFADELHLLTARLREMGVASEAQVSRSMRGLVEADRTLLRQVIAGDESINRLHLEIDDRAFKLLALFQPVAVDLRSIVSAVKINSDLERIGDLAVNIAEAAKRYAMHPPVKKLIDIPKMADIAQAMLRDALDSYVKRDMALARQVLHQDDSLDALKTQIFRELLSFMLKDPSTIEAALDLILVSRHLERIGDHATNVAEDVIFMVSARDVRHNAPEPDLQRN